MPHPTPPPIHHKYPPTLPIPIRAHPSRCSDFHGTWWLELQGMQQDIQLMRQMLKPHSSSRKLKVLTYPLCARVRKRPNRRWSTVWWKTKTPHPSDKNFPCPCAPTAATVFLKKVWLLPSAYNKIKSADGDIEEQALSYRPMMERFWSMLRTDEWGHLRTILWIKTTP